MGRNEGVSKGGGGGKRKSNFVADFALNEIYRREKETSEKKSFSSDC